MNKYKPLKQKLIMISTVLLLGFAHVYVQQAQAEGSPKQNPTNNQIKHVDTNDQIVDPGSRIKDKGRLQQSRWDAAQRDHDRRADKIRRKGGL